MAAIEIRAAGPDDSAAILRAAETTFHLHNGEQGRSGDFAGSAVCLLHTEAMEGSPRHALYVADLGGELVGYMLLSAPEAGSGLAMVNDIWVSEPHRGKGIAPALIAEAMAQQTTQRWDYLAATVADWNHASTAAFRRAGFLDWKNHGLKDDGHRFRILLHPGQGRQMPRGRLRRRPALLALGLVILITVVAWSTR